MRFFYAPKVEPLHRLDAEESKHMVRVLRAKEGEEFDVIDGKGKRYRGILQLADKRSCVLQTHLVEECEPPQNQLTLVIAPTKSTERFEWLLEKAMEYGVRRVQPVWTERSERKVEKYERWNRILIGALKQSQQLWLTELKAAVSWEEWLANDLSEFGNGFIAHCEPGDKRHFFDAAANRTACWIGIGPEGDFTSAEIGLAVGKGVEPVSLGAQRLRTETAGLSAIQMFALAHR